MCLKLDCFDKIVAAIGRFPGNKEILKNAVWTMCNLTRIKPLLPWEQISKMLPTIKQVLLEEEDGEIVSNALWSVSYLTGKYCSLLHGLISL